MKPQNDGCERCSELVASRKRTTWGYGAVPSRLMFVGEAPGRWGCDVTGIPFTKDRSGELFQQALKDAGIDFEKVYTTNVVKCCPPGNRTPTEEEVVACRPFLEQEIAAAAPMLIVAMGKTAVSYFQPFVSVTRNFGRVLDCGGCTVLVTPHPAYILRSEEGLYGEFVKALRKAKAIVDVEKQKRISEW